MTETKSSSSGDRADRVRALAKTIDSTDAQLATVRLERHRFHGDWNDTIHPGTPSNK